MNKTFFVGVVFVFSLGIWLSGVPAAAEAPETYLKLEVRYWWSDLDAQTSLVREGFGGGRVDLHDELGLDDDELPEVELRWQMAPRHGLRLSYMRLDTEGSETSWRPLLLNPLRLDDTLVGGAYRIDSDLELNYFRLGWYWSFLGESDSPFSLELMLDAAVADVDAGYDARYLTALSLDPRNWFGRDEDDWDGVGGLPLVGLAATVRPFERLHLHAQVEGMTGGSYGYILDAEASAEVMLGNHIGVKGGYRDLRIKLDISDDDGKVEFSGPFVGASVKF